jgi:hypothetical protein
MGRVDRGMRGRQLNGLFEEYRALYELVVFRMTALDRRAPVTAGALLTAVATLDAFPTATQTIILLSLPAAVLWFVRTTVNHARSFEDVLRRIEEIERSVNEITGRRVMCFQSSHPSRGRQTGGRTGQETVAAVLTTAAVLLIVGPCRMMANASVPLAGKLVYIALVACTGSLCIREVMLLKRYRYVPQGIEPTDAKPSSLLSLPL